MIQPWQERTLLLMGEEKLDKLAGSVVAVIGLGGVGAYAAEIWTATACQKATRTVSCWLSIPTLAVRRSR